MGTSYERVMEIARRIEGVHQRSQEQITRDKRFRYSGEFRGALYGGRGQFVRGQSSRPPYPAPPPPRDAPVRPYLSAIPESSYRPPAIQGPSSGHSVPQGQTLSQQPIAPKSCYECGDPSHMRRFCPRLRGRPVQHGQQPMLTGPVAPPVVRPPRGGGQVGRVRLRGAGQPGGGQPVGAPARFYAFPARPNIEASDAVITDCHAKTVTLAIPSLPRLEWKDSSVSLFNRVISFIKAQHMVEKGYLAYLAYVRDTSAETPAIDSVPVAREFSDVFPSDLPGVWTTGPKTSLLASAFNSN
ncbi:uncharacterized protein [Nicotiana tomentosiformis]|uniref:uncharacterized protein n=1 Tax=Nicotiana tomentosiformis TaxID=4098 RepID=UPI00388CDDF0